MAIWIDWPNRIINVPRADMLLKQSVPTEIRELEIDGFRRELKALEDNEEGIIFPDTHKHNTIVTLGGVTYARLIEIINNYTVTFEDGQYAVNLVGANSNIGDVVNVNQVSVRSANSAGLTYSKEVEDQSFLDGRVWINTIGYGYPGTQFPQGTPGSPTDGPSDAKAIVSIRSLAKRFRLKGPMVTGGLVNFNDDSWLGDSPLTSKITFSGDSTDSTAFERLHLVGEMNGMFTLEFGFMEDVSNFEGNCYIVGLLGTLTLPTNATSSNVLLHKCYSGIPGEDTPIVNFNDATNVSWSIRGYAGGIEIQNYSDSNNVMTIDLDSGHVILASTVTAGTIVIRGDGHVTDNSGPNVNVITDGLSYAKVDKVLLEKRWIALH